ncbi:hypothetical protein BKM01_08915 [Methanohalophilus portucalensis]|uniref:Uncharacterized protein n=3 Tax=Methanohalophilus portucalensis TaxID=39664 RepID=A0A1X7MV90_9EURY|nr:hypothetical protein [Methanohalophilus portucalensis]ATU08877.1 hypothetical protein BKM01_08915 [Methanohalophilus portucalensis]SMH28612.1 hypothetical protein SAMN06264941_0068 [Methanohalophilus portucalensis FDF-1]
MRNIPKFQISILFAAMLLMACCLMPTVSAKENLNPDIEENVTIRSLVADASLSVDKHQGTVGSNFDFEGEATYEAEVYGVPLPEYAWFANDISYEGFNKPEVTSSSEDIEYVYKSNTAIGKAWTHRYSMGMFGGPTNKHVYSNADAKNTGRYKARQYAGLTLANGDNAYVYVNLS